MKIRGDRIRVHSEKGRPCTVQNPWPGKKIQLVRHGKVAESASGERFTFGTAVGETIELREGEP